jgi:hypothetical protein
MVGMHGVTLLFLALRDRSFDRKTQKISAVRRQMMSLIFGLVLALLWLFLMLAISTG